ncbi:MAG: response regulator [Tatlockia sp.]|nr:response regulator [Tatlockia sp.]
MTRATNLSSAEISIEELKQYYLSIIDSMPGIVYLLDRNCSLTGTNKNFRDLFGLENQDLNGQSLHKIFRIKGNWSEERVQMFKREDIEVIISGEAMLNFEETPVVDANNEIIYFQSSRIPLFNIDKDVIGLLGIFIDISEMKKMKEQYDKIRKQLQNYDDKYKEQLLAINDDDHKEFRVQKTPKVLMVEDNSAAQKAAQALLMQLDCHVDVADSGDKTALLFEPGKYDLVFMDIGLEDTSGYVVSKKIRQLEKGTSYHVPIIALTGYEADIVKYDCDDYSMEGALTKPLTPEQAKQIIQHYIYHLDIPVRGLKTIKGQI